MDRKDLYYHIGAYIVIIVLALTAQLDMVALIVITGLMAALTGADHIAGKKSDQDNETK